MKNKITIITGKIRSGKTTYLRKLISSLDNVEGIIQIADEEKRFFVDISSGDQMELTSQSRNSDTFNMGNFIFSKSAFTWAKEKLEMSLKSKHATIVIDEYGLLELNEEGLEPFFSKIINKIKANSDQKLLVVVREGLLKDFLRIFNLNEDDVKIKRIANKVSQ